jgi:cytochrome c peroxidase
VPANRRDRTKRRGRSDGYAGARPLSDLKKAADIAAFKTSDVRDILVTGPYFHDGSQETLWDVIDHYNKGDGLHNPYLDQDIRPLALTEQDIDDLVAFLASLTSPDYKEQGPKSWRTSARSRSRNVRSATRCGPSVRNRLGQSCPGP